MAARTDHSWKQQSSKLVLIRNNRWYRDDALEVPSSVLRQIGAAVQKHRFDLGVGGAAHGSSTLDEIREQADFDAKAVRSLSPWQIARGLSWAAVEPGKLRVPNAPPPTQMYPFALLADRLMRERHTMQFYSNLPSQMQDELVAGTLRVAGVIRGVSGTGCTPRSSRTCCSASWEHNACFKTNEAGRCIIVDPCHRGAGSPSSASYRGHISGEVVFVPTLPCRIARLPIVPGSILPRWAHPQQYLLLCCSSRLSVESESHFRAGSRCRP